MGASYTVSGGSVEQTRSRRDQWDEANRTWVFDLRRISGTPKVTPFVVCFKA